MDIYCEHLVKRQRGRREKFILVGIIVAAIFASLLIFIVVWPLIMYYFQPLGSIIFPMFIGVWYLAVRFIKRQNIEFEYALTSGELDVDKILNKSRRTRLLNMHCRNIELAASLKSDKYSNDYMKLKVIDAAGAIDSPDAFFALFTKEGQRQCLLFEPNMRMLDIMKKYNPDKVFLKE